MADLESAFLRVQDCMKVESVTSVSVPSIAGHDQNSARHHLLHSLSLHQYHNFTSSTHRSFPKYTNLKFTFLRMFSRKSVSSLQDIFMMSVIQFKLISFSRICKCYSNMVKLNCGFLETSQVIGINHHMQMHPLHIQWMINTWCSRYACSLQAQVLSCVLQLDNMLLTPSHALNFHASCVHVILVRGHNCTQSCASILLQKGGPSWRKILFRTASILLEKMQEVWPH